MIPAKCAFLIFWWMNEEDPGIVENPHDGQRKFTSKGQEVDDDFG